MERKGIRKLYRWQRRNQKGKGKVLPKVRSV
jgi:hypothetical protein